MIVERRYYHQSVYVFSPVLLYSCFIFIIPDGIDVQKAIVKNRHRLIELEKKERYGRKIKENIKCTLDVPFLCNVNISLSAFLSGYCRFVGCRPIQHFLFYLVGRSFYGPLQWSFCFLHWFVFAWRQAGTRQDHSILPTRLNAQLLPECRKVRLIVYKNMSDQFT